MSQFSDAGPSSRYESDADNLSFLRSDDAYLFTPESPSSQQTTASVQDSPFLRPPPPPSIPQSLGRVGPNRTKNFILYSAMNKADFMDWWLQTMAAAKRDEAPKGDPGRKFEWDGTRKHSTSWENLDQVAHIDTVDSCTRNDIEDFTKDQWEQQIVRTITALQLPFQVVEHPELQMLCRLARAAPSMPEFPSARTVQRRLQESAFMAITGYFIDQDWNYREILLGFEPLHGTHSGVNLSNVLLERLQHCKIEGRVLAITTDNASNNKTLMKKIQESLSAFESHDQFPIIRIPCLAHVIQLSLKKLLGEMKANPNNESHEREWSEARSKALRANRRRKEISDTLDRVRDLAIYINGSPQRREVFLSLQTKPPKLVPIQDVRTRWNSTYLMLRRIKKLQRVIDKYCTEYNLRDYELDREEWRQIEYLLYITLPFYEFTTALCQTKDATVHGVFAIYNRLFDYLDTSISQLQRKEIGWKRSMLAGLQAAKEKLKDYYDKTTGDHGNLYAMGTILAPQYKLQFFTQQKGSDNDYKWRDKYHQYLKDYREPYKQRFSDHQSLISQPQAARVSRVHRILTQPRSEKSTSIPSYQDELERFLQRQPINVEPLLCWKDNQHEFPVLASAARDILSIPATGAGVERLFNSARDICHYRRGSLKATTIQDLMMHMCTSRFDIEEGQLRLAREFLSTEEIDLIEEEKDLPQDDPIALISDDEQGGSGSTQKQVTLEKVCQLSLDQRRRSTVSSASDSEEESMDAQGRISDGEDGDDNNFPLPPIAHGEAF
ncbi:hypothetical protein PENFLA_c070G01346 [Penicillium flavigenum]|uniref:HAT C-terminal dimerisation domain-containing protein n=1 Tax=Penicillium flavigenum TaxID=254877 RepID=A0A1V6SD14_9EURO|nr:hypothetical protein PENFLA_c070G01346 [Penicillium flavigenum]